MGEERKPLPVRDVGIYTTRETFEHKRDDGCKEDEVYCYWAIPRFGQLKTDFDGTNRLWIAYEGRWQGYFVIHETSDTDENPCYDDWESGELRFWSESWHPFDGGPRKPFQGITYAVPTGNRGRSE